MVVELAVSALVVVLALGGSVGGVVVDCIPFLAHPTTSTVKPSIKVNFAIFIRVTLRFEHSPSSDTRSMFATIRAQFPPEPHLSGLSALPIFVFSSL